jgi:hypothetical protein
MVAMILVVVEGPLTMKVLAEGRFLNDYSQLIYCLA